MASPLSSMMHESLVKNMFNCDISYLGKCEFKNRKNREQNLSTKVYSIRLNRLLQRNDSNRCKIKCLKKIFKLTRISDLTHTISALYDTSLPDIGPVSVYDCICSPKAFTICILKDTEPHKPTELTDEVNEDTNTGYSSEDCLSSIEDGVKQPEPLFQHLFSEDPTDLNTGESEDEDEDTDPDHTAGLKTYIKANRGNPGVEKARILKSLIACATLERVSTFQLPGHDEWVIDLQLMSVREKYRGFNIGKYLINSIQNRNLVGTYDAIVTCSDSSAIQFYEKYAFCIDPILNSKYSHIGDIWTNTTKMCFIPPYCSLMDNEQTKQVIKEIESEQDLDLNEDLGSGVKEVKRVLLRMLITARLSLSSPIWRGM